MPPRSRLTAFDRLAPDQRAAVELVLRQGRSYGELADMLGLPEETIRARARGGLEALAPDLPPPARSGEIADWLLGQQAQAHGVRTRALVNADPATRRWTETVAAPLRELADVPELDEPPELPAPRSGPPARPRPLREPVPAAAAEAPPREPETPVAAPGGGSSRLGGAVLLGLTAVVIVGVVLFVLLHHSGSSSAPPAAAAATPSVTPKATATTNPDANDIVLRGPAGSKAVGLMRLFEANDGTVRFALAAQGVPPNKPHETYSIWFAKNSGSARLLGAVKNPVGQAGTLTSAGPSNQDVKAFPQWFASYDSVLVTLDDKPGATHYGQVVLSGELPHGTQAGGG